MPRQLRSRRSRPNYAALHTGEEIGVYVPDPEELESGSEFPENGSDADVDVGAPDDDVAEGSEDELDGEGGSSSKATPQVKKTKSKSQGPRTRLR